VNEYDLDADIYIPPVSCVLTCADADTLQQANDHSVASEWARQSLCTHVLNSHSVLGANKMTMTIPVSFISSHSTWPHIDVKGQIAPHLFGFNIYLDCYSVSTPGVETPTSKEAP
jgi:hypothetical protein